MFTTEKYNLLANVLNNVNNIKHKIHKATLDKELNPFYDKCICIICQHVMIDPLILTCDHAMCTVCFKDNFINQPIANMRCPLSTCLVECPPESVKPSNLLLDLILKLRIQCKHCQGINNINEHYNHTQASCSTASKQTSTKSLSVDEILHLSPEAKIPDEVQAIVGKYLNLSMQIKWLKLKQEVR